jgi:hypothetical protein
VNKINTNLSGEINEANRYARALEKSFSEKTPVVMDYGNATDKDLHERMKVTRITRPDCVSRDLMFQVRIPEDWERIFDGYERLSMYIQHEVRRLIDGRF